METSAAKAMGPPHHSKIKMLRATRKPMNGQLLDQTVISPTRWSNQMLFSWSNFSNSCGSRANTLTRLMPVKLSCMILEMVPICSCNTWNMLCTLKPKRTATHTKITIGPVANTANRAFSTNIAPITPKMRKMVETRPIAPVPTKRSVSPTSLVALLIKSPVWCLSWKAKGRYWTAL